MVIESSLWTTLRIATGPGAAVHRVDASVVGITLGWVARQQVPQLLRVDASAIQGGEETAPTTAVDRGKLRGGGEGTVPAVKIASVSSNRASTRLSRQP